MIITKCLYHYGDPMACEIVQLNHNPRDPKTWQGAMPVCADCRKYLHGLWRYAPKNSYTIDRVPEKVTVRPSP